VFAPSNWNMNITGDITVKFLLPNGAQILKKESGNPEVGVEKDRPIGLFVYSSPSTLSQSSWHIMYEMTNQRNLFWLESATLASFLVALVLVLILLLKFSQGSLAVLGIIGGLLSPLLVLNVSQFMSIGWSKPIFLHLLLTELLIFSMSIVALGCKSWNDFRRQKENQCPNCKRTSRYIRTRLTRKHFIEECECPECGRAILKKMPWKLGKPRYPCKSCGKEIQRIYDVQTGQFKNETRRQVEVQINCPHCRKSTWAPIQLGDAVE